MRVPQKSIALPIMLLALGCRTSGREPVRIATAQPHDVTTSPEETIAVKSAAFVEPLTTEESLAQPSSVSSAEPEALPPATPEDVTIESLQQLALANNPAVAQAAAKVEALRGKWVQAGLPPNPSAGYTASQIGDSGRAGQQGGYAGQEFITAGKLRLDQGVVAQEIQRAEQHWQTSQLRVTTDVRMACYAALVAQRRVDLAEELERLNGEAVQASKVLLEAQEIPRAGLLQTEVEYQNATILHQTSRNELAAAWRELSATVGAEVPVQRLAGDVTQLPATLDWNEQLARITATSPEMGAAVAEIMQTQIALDRARVEPVPNVTTQMMVQFDNTTEDTIVGVQAGVPLPLWNRNQGGIRQAQADIAAARRNVDRVEMDLKRRLAEAFQSYSSARAQAETYAASILPKAEETFELVQRGYRVGEIGYLDLLTAQRTYSQTNLAYLDALSALWASYAEIDGLLLSGSLATPPQ